MIVTWPLLLILIQETLRPSPIMEEPPVPTPAISETVLANMLANTWHLGTNDAVLDLAHDEGLITFEDRDSITLAVEFPDEAQGLKGNWAYDHVGDKVVHLSGPTDLWLYPIPPAIPIDWGNSIAGSSIRVFETPGYAVNIPANRSTLFKPIRIDAKIEVIAPRGVQGSNQFINTTETFTRTATLWIAPESDISNYREILRRRERDQNYAEYKGDAARPGLAGWWTRNGFAILLFIGALVAPVLFWSGKHRNRGEVGK